MFKMGSNGIYIYEEDSICVVEKSDVAKVLNPIMERLAKYTQPYQGYTKETQQRKGVIVLERFN